MTCGYCGFRNQEAEHRCRKCGRRPEDAALAPFTVHRTDGALATAARPEESHSSIAVEEEKQPAAAHAVQGKLFSARSASNVIPFESYASVRTEPARPRVQTDPARKPTSKPAVRRPSSRVPEAQASLDFLPAAPATPRTLGTTVEAVIVCEAPVATPLHRAVAAALDWAIVLIGHGLFLLAFLLAGGSFVMNKTTMLVFAGTLPLLAFTYGLLWALAATETPGMRWAQLQLTTFDGSTPELRQRMLRFGGSCLSLCTVIGLLWSLADEESLTWQDHISRTFPTPLACETQVFHRR
jgi:uncharacterized RDD family membrane protein YckC